MRYKVTEKQFEVIGDHIQNLIDSNIAIIREESEDWGLGEMDELDEIDSVEKITIDRIVPYTGIKVYIDIITNSYRTEFDNIRAELQYRLEQWVPNLKLFINDIRNGNELL